MKGKRSILCFIVLMCLLLFIGCTKEKQNDKANGNSAKPITLKLAYELPFEHPWGKAADRFKEIVEQKTNGAIKIEIFGAGQLGGSGREIQESIKLGSVDLGISSTPMELINPYQKVFALPYIFRDKEHAWGVLDGPIGEKVASYVEKENIKILSYWEDGMRQITNNIRPIETPKDLTGIKLRVPESTVRLDTFNKLGASPLAMPWSEVFTALQQGVIDGQENPLSVIENASLYECQEYLTISNHVYSAASFLINLDVWDSLTLEQQTIILEASQVARDLNRELNDQADKQLIEELENKGIQVNNIKDVKDFQLLVTSVWDTIVEELGTEAKTIIDEIANTK